MHEGTGPQHTLLPSLPPATSSLLLLCKILPPRAFDVNSLSSFKILSSKVSKEAENTLPGFFLFIPLVLNLQTCGASGKKWLLTWVAHNTVSLGFRRYHHRRRTSSSISLASASKTLPDTSSFTLDKIFLSKFSSIQDRRGPRLATSPSNFKTRSSIKWRRGVFPIVSSRLCLPRPPEQCVAKRRGGGRSVCNAMLIYCLTPWLLLFIQKSLTSTVVHTGSYPVQ